MFVEGWLRSVFNYEFIVSFRITLLLEPFAHSRSRVDLAGQLKTKSRVTN